MGLVLITNPVPPPLTVRPFWPFDDWLPIYFPGNGMAKKWKLRPPTVQKFPKSGGHSLMIARISKIRGQPPVVRGIPRDCRERASDGPEWSL